MQPPKLEKRPKKHKFWNHEIEDSHYYLEENWQEIIKNPKPRKFRIFYSKRCEAGSRKMSAQSK